MWSWDPLRTCGRCVYMWSKPACAGDRCVYMWSKSACAGDRCVYMWSKSACTGDPISAQRGLCVYMWSGFACADDLLTQEDVFLWQVRFHHDHPLLGASAARNHWSSLWNTWSLTVGSPKELDGVGLGVPVFLDERYDEAHVISIVYWYILFTLRLL